MTLRTLDRLAVLAASLAFVGVCIIWTFGLAGILQAIGLHIGNRTLSLIALSALLPVCFVLQSFSGWYDKFTERKFGREYCKTYRRSTSKLDS
jgi:hypothetical protein